MGKVEDLRKELAELEAKVDEKKQIKDLKKKIRAKKFAQTKSGKVGKVIYNIGERFTRPQKKTGSPKKKKKVMSVAEVMANLPQ